MTFKIREMRPDDYAFVYATWLRGLYHGNSYYNLIDKNVFYENYHRALEALLPHTQGRVACLTDDEDIILGYSIHSGPRLHWVFTKKAWRKIGVAKALLDIPIDSVSHLTDLGIKLKKKEWIFNPFL